MSGYSQASLAKKLGLKAGERGVVINPPANYSSLLSPFYSQILWVDQFSRRVNFAHLFITSLQELLDNFTPLAHSLEKDGQLWVSWPKGSPAINENQIREHGLSQGLVDVKVIAVDEKWSGLKFVYRLKNR